METKLIESQPVTIYLKTGQSYDRLSAESRAAIEQTLFINSTYDICGFRLWILLEDKTHIVQQERLS